MWIFCLIRFKEQEMSHFYNAIKGSLPVIILTVSLCLKATPEQKKPAAYFLPYIGIRINNGAAYTNKRKVQVEVKSIKSPDNLITEMQIGTDPQLTNTPWQKYTREKISIELPGNDGEKVIYVRLRDKAGNLSPIESNKIILDTQPPKDCKIVINKGAKYTNDHQGRVLINAYTSEPGKMMLCNKPDFKNARWENYVKSKKWIIDIVGEGEKTVYAKFRDRAGNESDVVSASIIYDITPPKGGTVTINNGEKYTRKREVMLNISAKDVAKIRVTAKGFNKVIDFTPDDNGVMKLKLKLDSLEGLKTVRIYYMDAAGNKTVKAQEAAIHYKFRGPPPPLVIINQNAKFTNAREGKVDIKITSKANPELFTMMISNNADFKGAKREKFRPLVRDWTLPSEKDGLKTVYVRLFDQAGNASKTARAEIILDRTPPVVHSFSINDQAEWSKSIKVNITSDVQDAAFMKISNKETIPSSLPWVKYQPVRTGWTLLPGDGMKKVYAIFRDEAGNQTAITSAEIHLDTQPPIGGMKINDGAKYTNHPEGLVKLNIQYDEDAIGIQVVNKPEFEDVKLQPVIHEISNWKLEGGDGTKTVFMRLKDRAGNLSKVYTASIILDRTPPSDCSILINNGDKWLRNKNGRVSLSLRAEGAGQMMISNDPAFTQGKWIPFRTAIAWTIKGPEGPHKVYAKFRDEAGNESEAVSDEIISDFNPPKVQLVTANDGKEYCNDPQKTILLRFEVTDAVYMAISNNSLQDTSRATPLWEPYAKEKKWTLEGEDGIKTVFVLFKDKSGNVTPQKSVRVILDRTPPSEPQVSIMNGAKWLINRDGKADLTLKAIGAGEMMISNTPDFKSAKWEKFATEKKSWPLTIKGDKATVYVKFRDFAGNESETVRDDIMIDLEPPANPSIKLEAPGKYLTQPNSKIALLLHADGAIMMRISRNPNFKKAKWVAYEEKTEQTVTGPDGKITFYVQFRDEAGNVSKTVSTSILLDTTPPKIASFTINDGSEWTNAKDKKVTLHIKADGAKEMKISDRPGAEGGKWVPFKSNTDYILPGEDGQKHIFVQLRDEAGNVSRVVQATINLKRSF